MWLSLFLFSLFLFISVISSSQTRTPTRTASETPSETSTETPSQTPSPSQSISVSPTPTSTLFCPTDASGNPLYRGVSQSYELYVQIHGVTVTTYSNVYSLAISQAMKGMICTTPTMDTITKSFTTQAALTLATNARQKQSDIETLTVRMVATIAINDLKNLDYRRELGNRITRNLAALSVTKTIIVISMSASVIATTQVNQTQDNTLTIAVALSCAVVLSGFATLLYFKRKRARAKELLEKLKQDNDRIRPMRLNPKSIIVLKDLLYKEEELTFDLEAQEFISGSTFLPLPLPTIPIIEPSRIQYQESTTSNQSVLLEFLGQESSGGEEEQEGEKDNENYKIEVPSEPPPLAPSNSKTQLKITPKLKDPIGARIAAQKISISMPTVSIQTTANTTNTSSTPMPSLNMSKLNDDGKEKKLSFQAAPARLKRKKSFFAGEAERVFKWLDEDGDGVISDYDLTEHLKISRMESRALVEETKMALHGKVNDTKLTFQEFSSIMSKSAFNITLQTINDLPVGVLKRYRLVYDSIDVDGSGTISTAELAADMGLSDASEASELFAMAGLEDKDELTFQEFVLILRKADTDRVTRTLMKLFEETEQGKGLADAARLKREAGAPKVIPQFVEDIWDDAKPNRQKFCKIENIRSALYDAHDEARLEFEETDMIQIMFELAEKANDKQEVTFDIYWNALSQYVEIEDDDDIATLTTSRTSESDGDDNEANAEEEMAYKDTFETLVGDDGELESDKFKDILMQMVAESDIQAETRTFCFQLMSLLEDGDDLDLEEFKAIVQGAAESSELDTSGWSPTDALEQIRMYAFQHS